MSDRLKSRKLWVFIGSALVLLLAKPIGLDLSPDQVHDLVLAVSSYLIGQGIADHGKK